MSQSVRSAVREQEQERKKDEKALQDWEPVHDSIGVTHWLPPKRSLACDG